MEKAGPKGLETTFSLACGLSKENNSAMFLDIKDVGKGMYVNGQRHRQLWKGRKGVNTAFPPSKRALPT